MINAQLLSRAKTIEENARGLYHVGSTPTEGYWATLDLTASAAFRQKSGPEEAFRRAVTFAQMIRWICEGYPDADVFKEVGDGLFVHAADFRTLLELAIAMDAVACYWDAEVRRDERYPSLECRVAISYGECLKLGADYVGGPLDIVARLGAIRSSGLNCVAIVDSETHLRNESEYERDYPFLRFSESKFAPPHAMKAGEEKLRFSEILIDRVQLRDYSGHFTGLRYALAKEE
jgi:hypothetical protein